ncbi:hypothetical protein [Solitalea lacus]|uniref:hypothetical protein n=1 Tax=Solitalea lacus TaxID=2911172 RepID=UPI001EDBEEC7|nr:hypothetical protein [Solitalea lacus]UKJ08677.1 hypothetical protein L2B55_05790 [Solitalea lacus]
MTREDILGRIGAILEELKTECRSLYVQHHVTAIDLELFEANAKFLKEHIAILKRIVEQENIVPATSPSFESEDNKVVSVNELIAKIGDMETKVQEVKSEPPIVESKFEEQIPQDKEKETFVSAPSASIEEVMLKVEEKAEELNATIDEQPELTLEEKLKREEEAWAELNKRFQTKVPSVNDKISSINKDKVEVNTSFNVPVTDLRKAIGLNDKFAFIKGLFNNSVEAFEHAIADLNACHNYEEANRIIEDHLAPKFSWSLKPELLEQFNALVKKRFNV